MKAGIELITEERTRQVSVEGWTAKHDDHHVHGEHSEVRTRALPLEDAYALAERQQAFAFFPR